jgi:hypothetical protein
VIFRSLFEQISGRIGTPVTPAVKTQQNYPKVRFWRREAFCTWMTTAEASTHTHWKLAYLEDETGKIISEQTLKALQKKIKSAWKDLVMNKNAPRQWGKASASAKDYVYRIIYK